MATNLEAQYHIPQSDNDKFWYKKDGGEYTVEAVEALLEPELQPYATDQGQEPVFSDKALIVMAVFAGHTNAIKIIHWRKGNFENPRYRNPGIGKDILYILESDDDFVPNHPNLPFDHDPSPLRARWELQLGLRRLLRSMRDRNGHRFSPYQHIMHHANKLKSRAAIDPALPTSKHSSEEQELSASKFPRSTADGVSLTHWLLSRSLGYPNPMLGGSANDMMPKSIGGGDTAARGLFQWPQSQCWEHGCNGRLFPTVRSLILHRDEKSETQDKHNPEDAASSIKSLKTTTGSNPTSFPASEPLPGVAEMNHEPRPRSSTSLGRENDAGLNASIEGSGHELTDDDAQNSMIDAALDYQLPVKGRLVNGPTFGLSLQQEHGKDSQRSTTGGEDGCSTQEQSGRSSHTAGLDYLEQAYGHGPNDREQIISSILHESPLPETSDRHDGDVDLSFFFNDAEFGSWQIDDIDTWSAHIESKNGSLKFARKHPEIAEYKDQDYRDQSVSFGFSSRPWIEDSFSQPLEMEKKIDSQLEATEETKGLDSLESGNGRNYIEDVQAASRLEATMLNERHESIDRGTLLIFFFVMVATISIVLELIPRLIGTLPLWISALITLCQCLGIGLYAASDPVLRVVFQGFGRKYVDNCHDRHARLKLKLMLAFAG
jgi:hypothetical protein